jgi:hypothetical protein
LAAGHALATHRGARFGSGDNLQVYERYPDLYDVPYPCRWCGCTESQVLAALLARPRDKFPGAPSDGRCSRRGCPYSGFRVRHRVLCLRHAADDAGLEPSVLFGEAEA